MKKIFFILSVLCTALWSCDSLDLDNVGYGDADRLKASQVKARLYDTADGCWTTNYEGHEFYFEFHGDQATVTMNTDFLVSAVESAVSFSTYGKAVQMTIGNADDILKNLGPTYGDTRFVIAELPADGGAIDIVGQTTGNTITLQPASKSSIDGKLAAKADFIELLNHDMLDNQVLTDASGTLVGYYSLTLNGVEDIAVKVLTLENRSGNDAKGHVQLYTSKLTKDGRSFRLDTPVNGIKATNGKTYAFTAIDCSGAQPSVAGMTDVTLTSNKNAVSDFDYTSGNRYSVFQRDNKGDACDEIWDETTRYFKGIDFDYMHPEGFDFMQYDKADASQRPLIIWRDWYKNIVYPSSQPGANILMNSEDKDRVHFDNLSGTGISTDMGRMGQDATPQECAEIKEACKNLIGTWFSNEGLFVVRQPGTGNFFLLCPDTAATPNGGMWMLLQKN